MKFDAFWLTTELSVDGRSGSIGAVELVSAGGNEAVMAVEDMGVFVPLVAIDT